ncbi:MAG: HAMP domain-containing histidine kinase [Caldilineaceae bacterium]|nr:HAMP domain-containing histidine kinase [Caldilineaceae bacterium]
MRRHLTPFNLYLSLIGAVGFILVGWSLSHLPSYVPLHTFALLVALTVVAALAPISSAVSEETGFNYGMGAIVSLAAFPQFGNAAAVLIGAIYSVAVWLNKPADQRTWKKNSRQLIFNTSMQAIAIFCAGEIYEVLRIYLGTDTWQAQTLPWIAVAVLYEEINLWLLIGILRLQQGPVIKPLRMWREERAASQIILLAAAMGGGMLGYAIETYHAMGVIAFFWPILLSAYAFRLYVQQVRSHLENLENIVAERTHDLAELNRQKDAYLAVLTHDMMTPLTSIQLCAEELQADPTAAENSDLLHFLLRSQRTLFTMVRNILDIEKLQTGGALTARKTLCDLAQILHQAVVVLRGEAGEKQITVTYAPAVETLAIYGDANQLERIVTNLLSNAIKYTPQGGEIHVTLQQQHEDAVITFADTGYGIPEHELPYIFERFRRVEDHVEKATGSGLGLAITKALIEEHQGQIAVTSTVGEGSTFVVTLPQNVEKAPKQPTLAGRYSTSVAEQTKAMPNSVPVTVERQG